jgi:G3E family GTPase
VAQTFFMDVDIARSYLLDAIVTMVDARHAMAQLDEHHEAQEQVGFADRVLISNLGIRREGSNIEQDRQLIWGNSRGATIRTCRTVRRR